MDSVQGIGGVIVKQYIDRDALVALLKSCKESYQEKAKDAREFGQHQSAFLFESKATAIAVLAFDVLTMEIYEDNTR